MIDELGPGEERVEQNLAEAAAQPENLNSLDARPPEAGGAGAKQSVGEYSQAALSTYQARSPVSKFSGKQAVTTSEIRDLPAINLPGWLTLGGLGLLLVLVVAISLGFVEGWLDELFTMVLAGLIFAFLLAIFFLYSRRR